MRCKCRQRLIKWGRTRAGTVRWRCTGCGLTRTRQKHGFRRHLLLQYLIEGKTAEQLSEDFGVHPNTIRNRLERYFKSPPENYAQKLSLPATPCWLITDATHFKRWGCLFVTKATGLKQPLAVSFQERESFESTIKHLDSLKGLAVVGYTTDGKKGLVLAHRYLFPNAKHQRCLVHIRMKVQTLLTHDPRLTEGKELLSLSSKLTQVTTSAQAHNWWNKFYDWQNDCQRVLNERSYSGRSWWYTHKNLRRAWKHILNAVDNLFVFLEYPNSVSHTNHLEGLFGQRKPALYRHRGLSRRKVSNVLLWTFYLLKKR